MAADSEFTPVVTRLGCPRGISTLTAFGLAVEIGDWDRFTGRSIGAYLGLVPTEYSSGATRSQGGLTKTGNSHVRRLLVEGGLASSQTVSARTPAAAPLGRRLPGRPGPRAGRQSASACPLGRFRSTQETSGPTPRLPGSWRAGAGRWPPWMADRL